MLPTYEEVCPHILFTYLDPHLCSTAAICKPGIPYFLFSQGQTSIKFADFVPHFNYELLQPDTSKQPQTDPQAKYSGQLIKYSSLQ